MVHDSTVCAPSASLRKPCSILESSAPSALARPCPRLPISVILVPPTSQAAHTEQENPLHCHQRSPDIRSPCLGSAISARLAARRIRQHHLRPDRLRLPRGRRGPFRGRRYPVLHAGHAPAVALAAGVVAPAATGSLAPQWIWWQEGWSEAQAGCGGRYEHGRGCDWQGVHVTRG
jgi:hypothetical protein